MVKGPDLLTSVHLRFPVTFSVVATIGLVLVTAAYAFDTHSAKSTLIFFLAGAAAVGQITASFYTARMLAATLAIRDADMKGQANPSVMQLGSRWNDPAMYHARDALREILDHDGSHDELTKLIDTKRTNVIHILNFLEEIATAVKNEMADAALVKTQFSGVVVLTWSKVIPWIQSHRKKRGQPDIWEDLESVYDSWK